MTSVWYTGRADVRIMAIEQWAAAGIVSDSNDTWDSSNGWSIPESAFTPEQITLLASLPREFRVHAPDGPRPGAAVMPPEPRYAELDSGGHVLPSVIPASVVVEGKQGDTGKPGADARVARGVLVISWDDGWVEHYSLIAPLADELGQKHTFYVNGGLLGQTGRMTQQNVIDLHGRGHEIGWHGATHTSFTSLTPATRSSEWDASEVEALIGDAVKAFAYPYGHMDATTDGEAYLRFTSVAALTAGFQGATLYDLNAPMPFVHYRWDWGATDDTKRTAPDLVRFVADNPVAVHLYAHRPDAAANPSWAQIEEVMRLAEELGVPVMRASDVFSSAPRVVNAGFESGMNFWLASPGGGGTGDVVEGTPMAGLSGTRMLKCVLPDASAFFYARQYVPVVPGRNYTMRAYAKCEGGGSAAVRIGGRSLTAQMSAPAQGAFYTGTEWGVVSQTWTAPPNVRWAQIDVIAISTAGTVYFDHVRFDETALI